MKTELQIISNRLDNIERFLSKGMDVEFININRLSKITGLSKNTLYKYISEKSIPVYKFGRLLRFRENEANDWMKNRIEQQSQSIAK